MTLLQELWYHTPDLSKDFQNSSVEADGFIKCLTQDQELMKTDDDSLMAFVCNIAGPLRFYFGYIRNPFPLGYLKLTRI